MALLQSQSLPGIGCCSSSIVLARARVQQCLAAASHSQAPLLQANGGRAGLPSSSSILKAGNAISFSRRRRRDLRVVAEAATAGTAKVTPASSGGVSLSDVLWPSAGAFLAMAVLGKMDQMVAFKGVSLTIAPLGAVCCVLFSAPDSPAAKKYNMFVAQIACAAFGVLALSLFGPGWLARGAALSACIAFMTITGTSHPPAASLPLLFIDGPKFHSLQLWYALFPGAAGCIVLCLIVTRGGGLPEEELQVLTQAA
ncbi:Integral membrane HPP family protein [Zea mays]|uniref:Integral membrane HPP family protein n=1 Tax=Zea mays TaxID=4577 RepID=A0A1D6KZL7_MAIZE|nr:Integral membrane HPP family protein [Zea mays]